MILELGCGTNWWRQADNLAISQPSSSFSVYSQRPVTHSPCSMMLASAVYRWGLVTFIQTSICSCATKSNIIMQRSQSKILRVIANVPWYVTNHTLRRDLNIPYLSEVVHGRINKHHNNLEAHPNPLLEPLLQPINTRRLKRCSLDLQDNWGDIAGWIHYHVRVIHCIVVYFV
jgi:hypothetical protein